MSRTDRPPPPSPDRRLTGIPVSPGIAVGPAHVVREPSVTVQRATLPPDQLDAEIARLDQAVEKSRRQIAKLRARLAVLPEDTQAEIAPLIDAYGQMLGASRLLRQSRRRILELHLNAEAAISDEVEAIAAAIACSAEDPGSRQRRADEVREIGRRLLRNLAAAKFRSFASVPPGAILVADAFRPSDAALVDPARIAGIAAEEGSADGHAAVMLRALGVPAVLGVHGVLLAAREGRHAIVDGTAGTVALHPDDAMLENAQRAIATQLRERQRLARLRRLRAITTDHEPVELQANLELLAELPLIAQAGAAGIGLLRTEFLFMNRDEPPDETTQTETYRQIVEAMDGETVTIRVLDWGGEKDIESISGRGRVAVPETNPALAVRGLRLLLREPALLETQLAAILRAAPLGQVRILLPMVTNAAEIRATRTLYARVARRLRRRGETLPERLPPLGIMVETPAAALSADTLALEADFLALGTNDLTMYTLAADRASAEVADLYDPLHPAVLRLMQFAIEAALRLRKPVSVCGEIAADPRFTPLLLGLGVRTFSMNAASVPLVKQAVRSLSANRCTRLAREIMQSGDPGRIAGLLLGAQKATK